MKVRTNSKIKGKSEKGISIKGLINSKDPFKNSQKSSKQKTKENLKENKYYFNNFYIKKNASNSHKKENYSYHSRKGQSTKSKQFHLGGNDYKGTSHYLNRNEFGEEPKLKGLYAKNFLMINKTNVNKLFSQNYSKSKKTELGEEFSESFLQKIWQASAKNKNRIVYNNLNSRKNKTTNSKIVSQLNNITKHNKKNLELIDSCKNKSKDPGSDLSKVLLETGKFKKSIKLNDFKLSCNTIQTSSPKPNFNKNYKYSFNSFLNSNRMAFPNKKFSKNPNQKEKQVNGNCLTLLDKKKSPTETRKQSSICSSSNIQSILKKIATQKKTPGSSKIGSIYNKLQVYANCQKSLNHVSGKKIKDLEMFSKKGSVDDKKNKAYLKGALQGYNQPYKNGAGEGNKDYLKSKRKYNSVHTPNVNHSPSKRKQPSHIESINDKRLKVTA
jgi:hypothetical protein